MTDGAKSTFECQRCGRCRSRFFELSACFEDITRWQAEGREDILQYADMYLFDILGGTDLWIDPETGEELSRCPFLRKLRDKPTYRCKIYETRPRICQRFPHLKYDSHGQLVGVHSWALDNCPGVKVLLEDLTPEQIQALRDQDRSDVGLE